MCMNAILSPPACRAKKSPAKRATDLHAPDGDPVKRFSARVRGRVQGVYFRASAREQARRLRLFGWVRNREDGSVELLAEGGESEVLQLLSWCRKGPPGARVDGVEHQITEVEGPPGFDTFEIRY